MLSFKDYLTEDTNADTATKVLNHLIKKHGAVAKRKYQKSNPYLNYQTHEAHHHDPEKLISALKDDGWEHEYHHPEGNGETVKRGNIQVSIWTKASHRGSVRVLGPKKAKLSWRSEYD